MPHLAANLTMMFTEWDFIDRFQAAADSGFSCVECLFPYEHDAAALKERLDAQSLTQVLFNAPPGDWTKGERGLAVLPERKSDFEDSIEKALAYARVMKVKRLHVMAGIADRDDLRAQESYRRSIAYACDQAAAGDVDILIEPLNRRDMPGYFLNDFDFAVALIKDLGLENLKLQYDIYHRQILHGDVLKSLEVLMPLIGHVQLASVPLRQEPMTGELDDLHILRHLDQLGYQGYVGLEYRPARTTREGLSWRSRL